jgi:hypothetical protein
MKAAVVLLLVIGAFAQDPAPKPHDDGINAQCIDGIIDVVESLKPLITDVISLTHGDFAVIKNVFDDIFNTVSAVKSCIGDCTSSILMSANKAQCVKDYNAFFPKALALGKELVAAAKNKFDMGDLLKIFGEVKALIPEIKTMLADCGYTMNPDDFDVHCFSDVADIAKCGYSFAKDVTELVKDHNISVLSDMLTQIEGVVNAAKAAKNDC